MAAPAARVQLDEALEGLAGGGRAPALALALAEVVEAVLVARFEGEGLPVGPGGGFEVARHAPLGRRLVRLPEGENSRLVRRPVRAQRVHSATAGGGGHGGRQQGERGRPPHRRLSTRGGAPSSTWTMARAGRPANSS